MVRLQKVISAAGLLSRRKAEEAIAGGRVTVNGTVVTELGTKVDPDQDEIRVDGVLLAQRRGETRLVLFHKPRRVVTTKFDPEGRRTVMEYLPEELQTLNPVGRLDYHSEGLLLLTDDGELLNRLTHPRYGVRKCYWVWVEKEPLAEVLTQLKDGVVLEDGPGKFEEARKLKSEGRHFLIEVVVSEGRNRFVRRMLDAVGHPVVRLKRIRIGDLTLGNLAPGAHRMLSSEELEALKKKLNLP